MTTLFLIHYLWSAMHPSSVPALHASQPTKIAPLAQPATLAQQRTRVIPDIGRPVSLQSTIKDHTVSLDDIRQTMELHPRILSLNLRRQHHQFYLSITAQSVLKSASQTITPAEETKPIYDFMARWGQTEALYRLIHEAPMEGTVEFQLPMHHATRDPSNNTTL